MAIDTLSRVKSQIVHCIRAGQTKTVLSGEEENHATGVDWVMMMYDLCVVVAMPVFIGLRIDSVVNSEKFTSGYPPYSLFCVHSL